MAERVITVTGQISIKRKDTRMRVGATATPRTTAAMVAAWPNCGYSREYGKDGPDADTLTDLTPDNTNKYATPGFIGNWHTSYKDDPDDVLTYRFDDKRWWTHYHEPADNMTGAEWLPGGIRLAENLLSHPDSANVLGVGPNLTRWQIANAPIDKRINPADFWDDIFSFFSADSYNPSETEYWTPERMFGPIRDTAGEFGVPWLVPEFGGERLDKDTTGSGRAAWIAECLAWLEDNGCTAVGWWDINKCRISSHPMWPEFVVLRDAMR